VRLDALRFRVAFEYLPRPKLLNQVTPVIAQFRDQGFYCEHDDLSLFGGSFTELRGLIISLFTREKSISAKPLQGVSMNRLANCPRNED